MYGFPLVVRLAYGLLMLAGKIGVSTVKEITQ